MRPEELGPTLLDPESGRPGVAEDVRGTIPDAERLAAGARAGDYEIEGFLGAGAMGDVYAGRQPLIGKRVAVKVIKRRLAASAEAVERFLREARAVNQVGHANVVDVFAFGRLDDGRLYLVMDLLEGESLGARLRRGRIEPAETLVILAAVAAALDAAHARGVVHRDLKPDNVFLAERGVFVLDFGIAKLLISASPGTGPGTLTDRGSWLGTPAYMAPEQWGADGAGPASDRYALGVMAFEMLAGHAPFAASSLPQMMEQHFRAPVPTLTGTGAAVPAAADEVLARAMAKDPDARFATAGDMVAALAGKLAAPRSSRRSPAVAILGVATAGAAIVTALIVMREPADTKPSAAPTPPAQPPAPQVAITSSPAGARVVVDGKDRGPTPLTIDAIDRAAPIVFDKPGYTRIVRTLDPAERDVRQALSPVTLFEGVWALPDGALRAFERRGDQVAMFSLAAAQGERHFERVFEFVAGDAEHVVWVAAEDHVDPRAPDEPSCHVPLQAEYAYDLHGDTLARRQERVKLDVEAGHCVVVTKAWGETVTLRRQGDVADAPWAESTAGAGNPVEKKSKSKPKPKKKAPDKSKTVFPGDVTANNPMKKAPPAKDELQQQAVTPDKK